MHYQLKKKQLNLQEQRKLRDHGDQQDSEKIRKPFDMIYLIDENPPWYICLFLGFQVRSKGYVINYYDVMVQCGIKILVYFL